MDAVVAVVLINGGKLAGRCIRSLHSSANNVA